jgi:hypothetical protein
MLRRIILLSLLAGAAGSAPALAQNNSKLSVLFRNIYGPNGLVVDSLAELPDGSTHSGHFNSGFQTEFTQINVAMASQLTSLPLPSPASGFTYTFDTGTGTFKRSTQSFGPILADRAETIGKGKLSFGLYFQQFTFDSLEGLDLTRLPAVFTHDDFQLGGGRADVVTTSNSIDARVEQLTAFLTYGITDRLDVSLAIPIVRTGLNVVSNATIERVGTAENPKVHFFRDPAAPGEFGARRQFVAGGGASGLGDIIVRAKGTILRRTSLGLALGVDLRAPTGDERDLLGSGAVGVKPFAALSIPINRFSPHINVAYRWNGKSELAGDVESGSEADLPDQFLYVAGADFGVGEKLTLAFDFIGQRVIDSPRIMANTYIATSGSTSAEFPNISFTNESFNQFNGAAGFKTNIAGQVLINFNLLFRLDNNGLRDKVTPLIGIEYTY